MSDMTDQKKDQQKPCVKLDDLEMAMSFVSSGYNLIECAAYISRETGKIYWESSELDDEFTVPDDVNDSSLYATVPDQHDLDLGRRLVMRFTAQVLPEQYDQVSDIFRRAGAYSRFKDFLHENSALEDWYKFEESAIETALCEWAKEEGFEVELTEKRKDG